jgi:peptide/nickel transport system ATP-binding protein
MPPAIQVDALTVTLAGENGSFTAVEDVSFAVAAGRSFGLVGESGSGKTTILRAICGLVQPTGGAILIEGHDTAGAKLGSLAGVVQLIFQDPYSSLHPRHTVDDILREPGRIQRLDANDRRLNQVLSAVGLPGSIRYRYPNQMSGGQRQRVAIARALMVEPRILLLDEPTSALDVSVQAEILNLLKDLQAEKELTYILVSHDLGVVAHLCHDCAVLKEGRIVESLPIGRLVTGDLASDYGRTLLAANSGHRTIGASA